MIKKIFSIMAVLIMFAITPKTMSASMGDTFINSFDASIQHGSPGTFSTGTRTIHSGGYIRVRFKVSGAPNPIAVVPPSVKGGCNGFDLFGGSFSMISADELISYFSDVASNAGGLATYLFMTYLQETCAVCSEVMNVLYSMQDMFNQTMQDSCTTATALVNGITTKGEGDAWNAYKQGVIESSVNFGTSLTNVGSGFANRKKADEDLSSVADSDIETNIGGNVFFRAIHRTGLLARFRDRFQRNDLTLQELYAYLAGTSGTVIKMIVNQNEVDITKNEPFIRLEEFIFGPAEINTYNGPLKCENVQNCNKPTNEDFKAIFGEIQPFAKNFVCVMEGKWEGVVCPGSTGVGLVEKLGRKSDEPGVGVLTDAEKLFVSNFGRMPLIGMLAQFGSTETSKQQFYKCFKERYIIDTGYGELHYAIRSSISALQSLKTVGQSSGIRVEHIELAESALVQLDADREALFKKADKECDDKFYQDFNSIYEAFKHTAPGVN